MSSSPVSRRTMLRNGGFASSVVASIPTVLPRTRPASARCCSTQVNTASWVSTLSSRRVREIVEWSGGAVGGAGRRNGCLRHSLLIRQPICVRAATRTMTARLG